MIVLWIVLGILAFLLGFIVITLYSKTRVYISYKNEKLNIRFQNGLIRYTLKQKEKQEEEKEVSKESIEKDVKEKHDKLTDKTSFLWKLFRDMRYRIEVKKVRIKVDFGTGDPADTGMLYGIIWGAIGNVYQIFSQYFIFDFPETEINPDFENKLFKIEAMGIIKVRLVHIISAIIKNRKVK
ncbi:MAG: DUF2953 domain-containing protein [Clostridia bacterium]|nr:DUF2953 domain-containing protein [Clostridia bacterium]